MADKILMTVILLIFLYLLLSNAGPANDILNALGMAYGTQLKTLQGR